MATTGELRAIIEELQLIDVGEAASFLGEEAPTTRETHSANMAEEEDVPQNSPTCDETE